MIIDRSAATWMQRVRVLVVSLVLALSAMPTLAGALAARVSDSEGWRGPSWPRLLHAV